MKGYPKLCPYFLVMLPQLNLIHEPFPCSFFTSCSMIGCNNLPQVSFCLSSPPFFSLQAQLEHDVCVSLLKKGVLLRHLSNNIT